MPLAFTPAGILFDCDGTLAHTMPLHYRAWRQVLDAEGADAIFPESQFYAWGGVTAREILGRLNADHGLALPIDALTHTKEMTYRRLVPEATPIDIVIAEARRFYGVCPLAVASGGLKAVVIETLESLGIASLFDAVVGSEDVVHGKPAPDVFLRAAEHLGVDPKMCVVFEDAPAGLEAARRAGMRAVDITQFLRVP
jgi:beta-phosphoglucomutase-like phosphatase (HAD superfamily)